MSPSSWEHLSGEGIAAAAIVYFLALLATLVEWSALLGRTPQEQVAEQKVLVGSAGAEAASGTAVGGVGGAGAGDGSGDAGEAKAYRAELFGRLGFYLTVIGALCHLLAVIFRACAADRVPWGNMYEFTLTGTCIVAVAYVALYARLKLSWMAPIVLAFVLILLMVDVLVLNNGLNPLTESLHSYWLAIHVSAAALATGAFSLGGIASIMYLLKARRPDTTSGWLSRVPSLDVLDRTAYRIHAFGFPIWTFAVLIAGPIWAHQAWGSYWNWDPKEVWAFITWVVYAGYLHARATVGWKGRNAAILAVVGLATLWFNFIGINYFSTTSMHSYADASVHATTTVSTPTLQR